MKDYIVRAISADGMVRAFVASTTQMVENARRIHSCSPVCSAALGRTLTATAIISQTLKGHKDTLTIQIKGEGPIGGIVAVSDSKANVRGYAYNNDVNIPLNNKGKLDVASAIRGNGSGYLNIIKDLGLKEPYIGYVDLVSGEVAEDIAYYYAYSEQVPSVVSLGVLVDREGSVSQAGGYIIQLLPGADKETIDIIESKVQLLPSITNLMTDGKTCEDILELILGEVKYKTTEKVTCGFMCNCSRDRMERNLISLGKREIYDMAVQENGAELHCHFCNKKYYFNESELLELII